MTPVDIAREHAKKQNAVIKDLRKQLDEKDATIGMLTGQLAETRDNARDMAESLEALQKSAEGDAGVAREIKRLNGQIRVLEASRNQCMVTTNELRRTVAGLRRSCGLRV